MKLLQFSKFLIKEMIKNIAILMVFLTLSSCNTLMPMLFGFREINGYDAEQCEKSRSEIRTVYRNLKRFGPSTGSRVEIYLINNDITMTKSLNGEL